MSDEISEDELLRRCYSAKHQPGSVSFQRLLKSRDPLVLEILIEIVRPMVTKAALRGLDSELRTKFDAEDVAQETLIALTRGFPTMESQTRGQFFSYLSTLLRNRLNDVYRRFRRNRKRDIRREQAVDPQNSQPAPSLIDPRLTPIAELIDNEMWERIRLRLVNLPKERRRVLRMRFVKQMAWEDIAKAVAMTSHALEMRVARFLEKLRREIGLNESSST